MKDEGLVSSCCGDLGNVFRSEGRYKDAEQLFSKHDKYALSRGDIYGLAIASGNIGFLKFYNRKEFDDSVECQFIEYSLAEQVGDFARMGMAFNKIGKLLYQSGLQQRSRGDVQYRPSVVHAGRPMLLAREWRGGKFKEALVLADASRGRTLAEIVRKRLSGCSDISSGEETVTLNEEFIVESFDNLVRVSCELSTTLVFYFMVKEFDQSWHGLETKVEVNDESIVSLRRSLGQKSQKEEVAKILRSCGEQKKVFREAQRHFAPLKGEEVLSSLEGFEHEFATAECPEEDPQDNSNTQSQMEKDKSSFTTSEESIQHPLSTSVFSHSCAYSKSDKAKSKISIASKPSGNPIDEEAMTTSLGGSGAPSPGLEHDITIKPSGEESNSSVEGNNNIEEENGEQFPVKNNPELDPWIPMLSQLHKILIEPDIDFLPRKEETRRVTFIPQDFLLKVPFAALQRYSRSHYFMEDFIISTSPAVHFLDLACASRETVQETTAPQELTLLAVGNPIMPFEELPQLPSEELEVRMIKQIINSPMSEILIGSQAQKTESGLECNGILTAEEVMGLELNANLVVLSCCENGLGKVTGDGLLGLSRAFLADGAACVIVTLWKIDDGPASELMMSFHREYKASRDAAVSLERSMKILKSKEDTRSPQHWAAFSIIVQVLLV
ncbi:Tetratricopeptide repeat protein 28 [Stylophora pistillata]|uniref:Tetratricopeptide repeat protein 28 n=1 Tax=Stylophora pistillata TaxID=50429 RepID=A0A2B4RDE7_STYPI|nr:Tetratricopeptide repeat protein 28 [Stylophora pistillata]